MIRLDFLAVHSSSTRSLNNLDTVHLSLSLTQLPLLQESASAAVNWTQRSCSLLFLQTQISMEMGCTSYFSTVVGVAALKKSKGQKHGVQFIFLTGENKPSISACSRRSTDQGVNLSLPPDAIHNDLEEKFSFCAPS
ncbi:hypothetical protein GOODEAATRI_017606 [Goodea atripinnis]|uniref:Uncharacterized protein n=1 Tax=Goodea atripinnis TaxID=208336 RepID=A0ABV0MTL5_9TELE